MRSDNLTHDPLSARLRCICGKIDCKHVSVDQKRDYYSGSYETCRLLLTSPRMNRPQREIIEEVADLAREHLVALGVKFTPQGNQSNIASAN